MRRSRAQERLRGLFRVLRVGAEDLGTGLCVPGHDRRAGTGSDPHQHVDPPDSQAAQDHTYLVRPGGPFPRGGLLHDGQPADVPADRGTACGGGGVPGPGYLHPAARRKAGGLEAARGSRSAQFPRRGRERRRCPRPPPPVLEHRPRRRARLHRGRPHRGRALNGAPEPHGRKELPSRGVLLDLRVNCGRYRYRRCCPARARWRLRSAPPSSATGGGDSHRNRPRPHPASRSSRHMAHPAPWLIPAPTAPPERRGGSRSGRGGRRSRAATGRRPWRGRPA